MHEWTIPQILEATGGRLVRGQAHGAISGITINSRTLAPGDAFIAIRGTRFDGHEFIEEAAHRGAACLIVSRLAEPRNGSASVPTILVEDTTEALGDLANFHRRRLGIQIVAVTGSCGKTTTKELIAHLLGEPDTVLRTTGTQNNHIGVPLTLLRMTPQHRRAVVELGSNHPGEIAYLASLVEPDVALITNIGPVHLEFLGSLMGVLQEKISLLEALSGRGTAILPGDQLEICLEAPHHLEPGVRVVTFGTTDRCDIQALDIQRLPEGMGIRLRDQFSQWVVPLVGHHNIENVLSAIACAWALGIPMSEARERLRSFRPMPLRSQVIRTGHLTILNDCYNANPLAAARALETLRDLDARRRIAVIGDMLELGTYAPGAHEAVGRLAAQLGIDLVIAVGEHAEHVARGVRDTRPNGVICCQTVQEVLAQLPDLLQEGDGLLIKGSRKLQLEQIAEFLLQSDQGSQRALTR